MDTYFEVKGFRAQTFDEVERFSIDQACEVGDVKVLGKTQG